MSKLFCCFSEHFIRYVGESAFVIPFTFFVLDKCIVFDNIYTQISCDSFCVPLSFLHILYLLKSAGKPRRRVICNCAFYIKNEENRGTFIFIKTLSFSVSY